MRPIAPAHPRGLGRLARRGMSLVEVMVVIAILVVLAAIAIPTFSSWMQLEQRRVAKELALTYNLLHDEAVLRNVTFRVGYHLDENYWQIEVGRPETLIFDDPEARQRYEDELEAQRNALTQREIEEQALDDESAFAALVEQFETKVQLPRGSKFGGVYTPQYGEMVRPGEGEDGEPVVVYSYVFPNGFSEHTVVQIVEEGDEEEGFTVEVEPLSGRVTLYPELRGPEQTLARVPEEGPALP